MAPLLTAASLLAAAALAVVSTYSCQDGLESDSDVFDSYRAHLLSNGDVIEVYEQPAYYIGRNVDYGSLDNSNIYIRDGNGEIIGGLGQGFEIVDCQLGPAACARGAVFMPGLGAPCYLDPEANYQLVLDGLLLEDGSTLGAVLVDFRTGPVVDGFTSDLCSDQVVNWWTIRDITPKQGIREGLAGTVTMIVGGVDDYTPFNNYRFVNSPDYSFAADSVPGGFTYYTDMSQLNAPPYIPVLKVYNNSDTALTIPASSYVRVIDDLFNQPSEAGVALPGGTVDPWETLPLYIGKDGSSYYMYDNGGDHDLDLTLFPDCMTGGAGCPVMNPEDAFLAVPAATWP